MLVAHHPSTARAVRHTRTRIIGLDYKQPCLAEHFPGVGQAARLRSSGLKKEESIYEHEDKFEALRQTHAREG